MNSRTATKHAAAQSEPSYPRDKLLVRAVAQRIARRTEYGKSLLAAGPPGAQQI
jgi:hypothetical protein